MLSFRPGAVSLSDLTPRVPFTRGVLHHARPARKPAFPSPLDPVEIKPTAGTSRARTGPHSPKPIHPSTRLQDTGLEFHHAPPASAPTYTTGMVPDVLKWVQGSREIRQSDQVGAPLVRRRRIEMGQVKHDLGLSEGVVEEIRKLRMEDPVKWTRNALCEKFDIPSNLSAHLARLAPTPKPNRTRLTAELNTRKTRWGFNKSVAREAKVLRRELW